MKQNMQKGLRSARQWLNRAEEEFGKDRDVRGELDLMLAKAELQRVSEANRSRQWRYKYPILRHAVAFILAVTVIGAGFGGFYAYAYKQPYATSRPAMNPPRTEVAASPAVIVNPEAAQAVSAAKPVQQPEFTPVRTESRTETERQGTKPETVYSSEKTVVLTPDEMQKLVRAAGKSLRGQ